MKQDFERKVQTSEICIEVALIRLLVVRSGPSVQWSDVSDGLCCWGVLVQRSYRL